MRVLVQRVSGAAVKVDGQTVGAIGRGFLCLVGVTHADTEQEAARLAAKTARLRVPTSVDGEPILWPLSGAVKRTGPLFWRSRAQSADAATIV